MRQDVFGVAYQEAKSELLEISSRFEQLRQRKERLQGVIAAIAPMIGVPAPVAPTSAPAAQVAPTAPVPVAISNEHPSAPAPEPVAYTFDKVQVPAAGEDESSTDPFQRRVRNALKFGSNGRDREGLQHAV
jgi:hypothetical protein